jgi:4-amino-4-deoxy-L-arabinose transferase-like glycosyltransferase
MTPQSADTFKLEFPLVGLVALASLCWGITFGGGFQGWDDLHYVETAQNWLHNGPSLPTDHWSGRLPYVLLLTASMMFFGFSTIALIVPNSILFLIVIATSWWIARLKFGPRGGMFSALLAATTPLFFRFPETFYPEALETSLCGIGIILVILALRETTTGKGSAILFGAGLVGGVALVLRATSAVVPLALALFILLEVGHRRRAAFILICSLAAGYIVPLLAECIYYYYLTGEPFYRYILDSNDNFASSEMVGEDVIGKDVLFNFRIAKLLNNWAPSTFKTHWSVSHLVNLFTTPALLLTPYFGLIGMVVGLRRERTRSFALLALFMLSFQYLIYTFIFILTPTPRYYAVSVLLFCVFGGLFFSTLSLSTFRRGLLGIQIGIAVMVGLTQIGPQTLVQALVTSSEKVSPIYISSKTAEASYIALARDRRFAEAVRVGFPPIGGTTLIGWDGWPQDTLARLCDDGTPQWNVLEMSTNPSIPWRFINSLYPKAAVALPGRIVSYLRRDVENTILAERRC